MNRSAFLNDHWKSYPTLSSRDHFFCGRVKELKTGEIELSNQSQSLRVKLENEKEVLHLELGKSISPSLLLKGDVVAFHKSEKTFFLLSPNLKNSCGEEVYKRANDWENFLKITKNFLESRGLKSIQTPLLVDSPGVDHHINFLRVQASQTGREWCLPTSPEIHLKKALSEGWEHIYEIKSCFRDDLPGPLHQTEFTMLEWYRSYWSLDELAGEVFEFFDFVTGKKQLRRSLSISEAFEVYAGLNLTPKTDRATLWEWGCDLGIDCHESDDWNDLFFRIFLEKVEPELGRGEVTRVFNFPASQASLAQINKEGWAERFEIYWQGVELANAYKEVNDPQENRRRFEFENQKRQNKEVETSPVDSEFLDSLERGMPPACGVALGLSRLYHQMQKVEGARETPVF